MRRPDDEREAGPVVVQQQGDDRRADLHGWGRGAGECGVVLLVADLVICTFLQIENDINDKCKFVCLYRG